MRTVPRRPPLNATSRKCSTKEGRSVEPVRGSQSMDSPSGPAMDVKVPHSWTVRSFSESCFASVCSMKKVRVMTKPAAQNNSGKKCEKGRQRAGAVWWDFIGGAPLRLGCGESYRAWVLILFCGSGGGGF